MSANAWWGLTGLVIGLLIGGAAGGWAAMLLLRKRFDKGLRRATDELHQRYSGTIEQGRLAQLRSQTELEQSRANFKRQLAVMAAEPRAAQDRAEERLKAAYAELDRLRSKVSSDTGPAGLTDGFAATRPMRDGM